jgi:uncharacterized protein (DUF2249 family)
VKHREELERKLKEEMSLVIAQNQNLMHKANSMERILLEKFSTDLRQRGEEIWTITQERNQMEEQLQRFLALPDPVGIGLFFYICPP